MVPLNVPFDLALLFCPLASGEGIGQTTREIFSFRGKEGAKEGGRRGGSAHYYGRREGRRHGVNGLFGEREKEGTREV